MQSFLSFLQNNMIEITALPSAWRFALGMLFWKPGGPDFAVYGLVIKNMFRQKRCFFVLSLENMAFWYYNETVYLYQKVVSTNETLGNSQSIQRTC